jgi:hypothetical protein
MNRMWNSRPKIRESNGAKASVSARGLACRTWTRSVSTRMSGLDSRSFLIVFVADLLKMAQPSNIGACRKGL